MTAELAPTETMLITGEELAAMGDIGPCELIEGRIVPMSPTGRPHGRIETRLAIRVGQFVEDHDLGEVQVGEVGIYIRRNPDTVRGADLAFISNARLKDLNPEGYLNVAPDLVVEITPALASGASVSPDDSWTAVKRKLREYFSVGVRLVWVVDPENRSISAYRSLTDVREFGEGDELPGDDVLPGFRLSVAEVFEE